MKHIDVQVTKTEQVEYGFRERHFALLEHVHVRLRAKANACPLAFCGTWIPAHEEWLRENQVDTPELRAAIEAEWHAHRTLADDELRRADGTVVRMTAMTSDAILVRIEPRREGDVTWFSPRDSFCSFLDATLWQSGTAERAIAWGEAQLAKKPADPAPEIPEESESQPFEANLTQVEAMAFALLFGDSHQAHLQGHTLGVDSWFVHDHENDSSFHTFEECLRQLADEHEFELRPWGSAEEVSGG